MDTEYKKKLEKQGYRFIGNHSAVKTCEWVRRSLKDEGFCYKQKFYGINSHRCIQMSPSVNFCNMDCVFCWRERNNSAFGKIDEPEDIIKNAITAQTKLLYGYKGYDKANMKKYLESQHPKHFAISLTGEVLSYPKIKEFIELLKKKNFSSFLVTNGQFPEMLEKINPTQLYISLSAPNEELFNKIDRPMLKDGWKKLMKSFEIMKKLRKKTRTTIRITLIKGINDVFPEQYAEIIKKAHPMFLEIKSYMCIGASRKNLSVRNMMVHDEVREFAKKISRYCSYKIIDEQPVSRVVLMMEKDSKKRMMKFN